jgi:hypothetical protein
MYVIYYYTFISVSGMNLWLAYHSACVEQIKSKAQRKKIAENDVKWYGTPKSFLQEREM